MIYVCRLVGKVAADNSHKWVFRDAASDGDPSFISSWNFSIEPVRQSIQFFCIRIQFKCKLHHFKPDFVLYYFYSNQEHGKISSIQAFRLVSNYLTLSPLELPALSPLKLTIKLSYFDRQLLSFLLEKV